MVAMVTLSLWQLLLNTKPLLVDGSYPATLLTAKPTVSASSGILPCSANGCYGYNETMVTIV